MSVPYTKPFLDVQGQLALLQSRGMDIGDPTKAAAALERIGYYRLSGYWHPFRITQPIKDADGKLLSQILDDFKMGTKFHHVFDLYVFDKRLRLLFLDAIERIEVALRVDIALMLGARDPWAHRSPINLYQNYFVTDRDPTTKLTQYDEWLLKCDRATQRSKEDFVKHFRAKYSSELPIWMAIELWDFGTLSTFLSALPVADLKSLSAKYGIPRWELLPSWVRAINHVRNICAHHSRLWNRSPADQPKPPRLSEIPLLDHLATDKFAQVRIYAVAAVMQHLLRTIHPSTTWGARLKQHLTAFPATPPITVGQTGFPDKWDTLPLWN